MRPRAHGCGKQRRSSRHQSPFAPSSLFALDILRARRIRLTDTSRPATRYAFAAGELVSHEAEAQCPGVVALAWNLPVIDRRFSQIFLPHCFLFLMPRTNLFTFPPGTLINTFCLSYLSFRSHSGLAT